MFSNYGPLCTEVYQLTKPVGTTLNGDIDYYLDRLDGTTGPILEAGVGTGRMLIPLLQEGASIEGIDQSEAMLAECQKNLTTANLTTNLYQGNLETIQLEKKYAGIIMPTSTFCLFETEEIAIKVLHNLYHHLEVGGRLIIDLDLPFYPELGEITTATYPLSTTSGITVENKTVEIDWLNQHIISYLTYQKWSNGQLVATELQQLLLRWYGLTEFRLILEKLGFEVITLTADYQHGEAPVDSNQTITFEATK